MQIHWLHPAARSLIEADALKWGPRETGDPLFGYENCGEVVITRAFPPGPHARHLPMLYRPDRDAVKAAIAEVYEESSGRELWIGSWHTHPLGRPRPSLVDRATVRRIGTEKRVRCPEPVMLIQTTRLSRNGLCPGPLGSFRWSAEQRELKQVEIRDSSAAG